MIIKCLAPTKSIIIIIIIIKTRYDIIIMKIKVMMARIMMRIRMGIRTKIPMGE